MKDVFDNFFFWVLVIVIVLTVSITKWIRMDQEKDLEMAKLGMCLSPAVGSNYPRWQPCK